MIRHLNPKKIIEVGSGFSSAVMLDTNEKFMQNTIHCSFIEPYPKRLKSLLKSDDVNKVTIHEKRLQEMSLNIFSELSDNDILFIDSTHVSKFNSDVNYVIHTILPKLEKGVHIHFHDVFYPFEYPANWLLEGKAWNENYILRAFLEYNGIFKIELFDTYLQWKFGNELKERFPFLGKDPGGAIWLKKCKDN
jgi:predicted O-methyltransferase YrrM